MHAVDEWLTPSERAVLSSLGGPRATEWAASRVAAKESVRRLLSRDLDPRTIEVEQDRRGVPRARVGSLTVRLSISHQDGVALAAAHRRYRVGVDVEGLRALPDRFSRYFIRKCERKALGGWGDRRTASLAAWTVKEAVLKATGRGLTIPPTTVEIRSMSADGRVAVAADQTVAAACWREDGAVVAVACAGTARLPSIAVTRGAL